MKKFAKNLCGTDIGKTLHYQGIVWDYKYKVWKDALLSGPITMIVHKKDLGVNVRIGPTEFHKHGGEPKFLPDAEVELS